MGLSARLLHALRYYTIPEGLLPLAPARQPFAGLSDAALNAAYECVLRVPEKRGILSHAIRDVAGMAPMAPMAPMADSLTVEAHVDGVRLPVPLVERLLGLGFEPDGFATFNPPHFSDHLTLKVKTAHAAHGHAADLYALVRQAAQAAFEALDAAPGVEAYVELELYRKRARLGFARGAPRADWCEAFGQRFAPMHVVEVPTAPDATAGQLRKRADIHVKLNRLDAAARQVADIADALSGIGFYTVRTWAGNVVCTGQFASLSQSRDVFERLATYCGDAGGVSELTMETVSGLWRTRRNGPGGDQLSAVPPLITRLN